MSILQQTINILYRHPKGKLRQIKRQGGLWNTWQINQARQAMENASKKLIVPKVEGTNPLEVHFLTGKKYWYQTIFCIYSLQKNAPLPWVYHIYDDGSFDEQLIRQVQAQAPAAQVHTIAQIEQRLQQCLPEKEYPFLWHKRRVYPHIKKLTDIHAGTEGWKLVLDSDMLFGEIPTILMEWLKHPSQPFFIEENENFYGYSKELMESLCQQKVRDRINVGVVGLKSEEIDWNLLMQWAMKMEEMEGASYFLEQALTAMIIGEREALIGDRTEYIVNPTKDDVLYENGTLHHYVDLSKEWYFKTAWKKFIN